MTTLQDVAGASALLLSLASPLAGCNPFGWQAPDREEILPTWEQGTLHWRNPDADPDELSLGRSELTLDFRLAEEAPRVDLVVSLRGIPATDHVSVDGTPVTDGAVLPYDLGSIDWKTATSREWPMGQRVRIEREGRPATETTVPALFADALQTTLTAAGRGGLPFPKEAPDDTRDVAVVRGAHGALHTIGAIDTLSDIDLVVLGSRTGNSEERTCEGYSTDDDPLNHSLRVVFQELEAVAIDRRTGAEVARDTMKPFTACPSTALAQGGVTSVNVSDDKLVRWARNLVETPADADD